MKLKPGDPGYDPYDFTSDEEEEDDPVPPKKSRDPKSKSHDQEDEESMETDPPGTRAVTLTDARYVFKLLHDDNKSNTGNFIILILVCFTHFRLTEFRSAVVKAFSTEHSQSLPVDQLTELVNSGTASRFNSAEVSAALEQMQDANQVMVSEGVVFLI